MFSGGVLSRNINGALRKKSNTKKRRRRKHLKIKKWPNSINGKFANWSEAKKIKGKNNPNLRPNYLLAIKGRIQLRSKAGCLILLGLAVLAIGFVLSYFVPSVIYGPIGIGIGIFTLIVAFTLLLGKRDDDEKMIPINDIYANFFVQKAITDKKPDAKQIKTLNFKRQDKGRCSTQESLLSYSTESSVKTTSTLEVTNEVIKTSC